MIILGLDPGSRVTGWGVIAPAPGRAGGWRALAWGAVRLDAAAAHPERIRALHAAIDALIGAHRPAAAAIESPFMGENAMSALKLGQVRGALILTAKLRGLAVHEYAPRLVKQAATGHGGAEKSQVAKMVRLQLGLAETPSPADAADALAVALTHASTLRARAEGRGPSAEGFDAAAASRRKFRHPAR
jgi:crossover junction endodeoxyribonuclease RuvC